MTIREELEQFDGGVEELLESVLSKQRSAKSLINGLVVLIGDEKRKVQIRATWLLKRLAESKTQFNPKQLAAILDSLSEFTHWEAKLHVCQMLPHVIIPKASERKVVWFLEMSLSETNKFLRAWAYNGFYELAKQHPEYFAYAMEQLDRGEAEKSAAVKARIRNIRQEMKRLLARDG